MWMSRLTTIPHLVPQLQGQFMIPISLAFNADLGTILGRTVPTTIAPTTIGQLLITTNLFVLNESVDYAERRDILSPTALLTMTGMTTITSRTKGMLETELVTQGNEEGSVTVFLSFLPLPYRLTISSSTYGHNVTQSPM